MGWSSLLAKHRYAKVAAYLIGAFLVWAIVGCGGGGGSSMGGKVSLKIAWPAPSRYIPPYAHSMTFALYTEENANDPMTLIVNRPDDLPSVQTVEFSGPIPAGIYVLWGRAKTGVNGIGDTVASATSNILVQATGTTTVALSLGSTLYSIELLDMPLTLNVGESEQLRVKILDRDKNEVLIPNTALTWSLLFGTDSVFVDENGFATGFAAGAARIRVSEIGADLYSDGDIFVNDGSAAVKPNKVRPLRKR